MLLCQTAKRYFFHYYNPTELILFVRLNYIYKYIINGKHVLGVYLKLRASYIEI
jgi:hypothetical protein